MLQQKIVEKINNIFGLVDIYFNAEELTKTNKLAILISRFDAFPINNGINVEQYFIRADFIFPMIQNNGWNIDSVMNRLTEYNQKRKDRVNIIYPYDISDDIYITLEFMIDKDIKRNKISYPIKDVEIVVTI